MGNKYKLLKDLIPLFPKECDTFIDLFGGSGTVSMNYQGKHKTIYNEFNHNIVELVKMMVNNNPKALDKYWQSKINFYELRVKSDKKNCVNGKNSYNKLRDDYNNSKERDYRDLFLLSCYSINHLIRFNTESQFNASNGSDSYNDVNYERVEKMHERFKNVEIQESNALDLNIDTLDKDTFIYCDPPYLNTEAVYNEKRAFGGWDINCDYKLFSILENADRKGIKWGLSNVFSNRGIVNQHLVDWCERNHWAVTHLDRNYNPFSRGNSNNDEVYICNYNIESKDDLLLTESGIKYKQFDLFDLL